MLTIGQLADYVGVTTRTVRHYHQCGLLPEPERDGSGYRRYDAAAVVGLIRIKAMADAGVPLARIQQLLAAGPAEFAAAVTEIDAALAARAREIQAQRRRVAQLVAGDRLFVPDEVAEVLERIRELGVSEQEMQIERDSWILLAARYPGQTREWARIKLTAFGDPEFRRIYRGYYEVAGLDPDDPRVAELAGAIMRYTARHQADLEERGVDLEQVSSVPVVNDPAAMAMVRSTAAGMPPAWERIDELCTGSGPGAGGLPPGPDV